VRSSLSFWHVVHIGAGVGGGCHDATLTVVNVRLNVRNRKIQLPGYDTVSLLFTTNTSVYLCPRARQFCTLTGTFTVSFA
jgi:hypothetical protein